MLSGLSQLNLELSSRCDKTHLCPMCGHQDQAINPIQYGEISFKLLEAIRDELEPGITISFHRDGEPTSYSRLSEALQLFSGFTTSLVTHGLTLSQKAEAIIGNCTVLTVSVFRGDADREHQMVSLKAFLAKKGDRLPQVQVKIVGDMEQDGIEEYEALGVRVIRRLIHVPIGNSKYAHRLPVVPEVGICLDALHRPTVDWQGHVYLCNRLDPKRHLFLGSLWENTLDDIWNGPERYAMITAHQHGRRDLANPTCKACLHWGTPSA